MAIVKNVAVAIALTASILTRPATAQQTYVEYAADPDAEVQLYGVQVSVVSADPTATTYLVGCEEDWGTDCDGITQYLVLGPETQAESHTVSISPGATVTATYWCSYPPPSFTCGYEGISGGLSTAISTSGDLEDRTFQSGGILLVTGGFSWLESASAITSDGNVFIPATETLEGEADPTDDGPTPTGDGGKLPSLQLTWLYCFAPWTNIDAQVLRLSTKPMFQVPRPRKPEWLQPRW